MRDGQRRKGKSVRNPLIIYGGLLHLQTIKLDFLPLELFKAGQIAPQAVLDDGFATTTVVLCFTFLIIFAESLKNHSKSQKIIK